MAASLPWTRKTWIQKHLWREWGYVPRSWILILLPFYLLFNKTEKRTSSMPASAVDSTKCVQTTPSLNLSYIFSNKYNTRINFLSCANSMDYERFRIFIMGKSKNPCLKKTTFSRASFIVISKQKFPDDWFFFFNLSAPFILLIKDPCAEVYFSNLRFYQSGTPLSISLYYNILILFRSLNTTSSLQQLYAGRISVLKKSNRKLEYEPAVDKICSNIDVNKVYLTDQLMAMQKINGVWEITASSSVSNFWNDTGL